MALTTQQLFERLAMRREKQKADCFARGPASYEIVCVGRQEQIAVFGREDRRSGVRVAVRASDANEDVAIS